MVNLGQGKLVVMLSWSQVIEVFKTWIKHIVSVIKLGEGHLEVYGQSRTEPVAVSLSLTIKGLGVSWGQALVEGSD